MSVAVPGVEKEKGDDALEDRPHVQREGSSILQTARVCESGLISA